MKKDGSEKSRTQEVESYFPLSFDEYAPEFEKRKGEKIALWVAMVEESKIPEELKLNMKKILEKMGTVKLIYGYYDIDDWVYYTVHQLFGVWFPLRNDLKIDQSEVEILLSEIRLDSLEFYRSILRGPKNYS